MRSAEQFETDTHNEQFILEIHTENPAHEARIRWEIADRDLSGKWGRLYLPESMPGGGDQVIQEPIIAFGGRESVVIDGQERRSIELSRSLALQLQESLDELGTAITDREHICDEPSRFPSSIDYQTQISTEHLDKMWWDSDRYLMWYSSDKPQAQSVPSRLAELVSRLDVYGYQIENGKLIHRIREYPSEEAVNELKQFLQRTISNSDTPSDAQPFRINKPLE